MDIKEYEKFYHVDISTQIDNKWKNDTALGIVKDSKKYSVKIKENDKKLIRMARAKLIQIGKKVDEAEIKLFQKRE